MTKLYDEPIEVTADPEGGAAPVAFSWRGRRYDVDQHLQWWREATETWNGNGRDRDYHRIQAHPSEALASGDLDSDGFLRSTGAVYDVYRDRVGGRWRLVRVWD